MHSIKHFFTVLLFLILVSVSAQHPKKDWYQQYSVNDTALGIDLVNALNTTPQPANAKPVIVAVIDGGTDILHEDLKANIWVNVREIPGNGVDDDQNGYVDDINGWDFIGGKNGEVHYDNLEMTRLLRDYKVKFGTKTSKEIAKADRTEYKKFKTLEAIHTKQLNAAKVEFEATADFKKTMDAVINEIGNSEFSLETLMEYTPNRNEAKIGKANMLSYCGFLNMTPTELVKAIRHDYETLNASVNFQLDLNYDPRDIVGDNYLNTSIRNYGNNEVKGPDALHGTHVAGIIGAARNNGIGVDGIANMVQIMVLRVVPAGDERDKDVANSIRYAVDNGAKVINMSFGKSYSFNKAIVDEAVKYAESKDVLIIHAAGNDGLNTDEKNNFPTPRYENGTLCTTWIEVGASNRDQSPASFSNYGKSTVNVFAPGSEIYNTVTDSKYDWLQGTSMASPVVAGVAALIRSYYPNLTAVQVKSVIETTVIIPNVKFKKPGSKRKKTYYKKLCTSHGIVNVNAALKAAAQIK
jgi:subtilisin family serine protease